jgi:hypothetical protein
MVREKDYGMGQDVGIAKGMMVLSGRSAMSVMEVEWLKKMFNLVEIVTDTNSHHMRTVSISKNI